MKPQAQRGRPLFGMTVKQRVLATASAATLFAMAQPQLAHAFHRFVVRMLASRLDFANREVAGLQR